MKSLTCLVPLRLIYSTPTVLLNLFLGWMVDCDSRPCFRDLRQTFENFAQDPARYLVIENDKLLRLPSYSPRDHTALLNDMLPDQGDMTDPFHYCQLPMSPSPFDISTPSTPLSPSSPTKPVSI